VIYPQEYEQKTGFDTIRQMLKKNCLCELGEKLVDKICFSTEFHKINEMICQTEEFRQILLFADNFPAQNYFDLTTALSRIKLEGTCLEIEELFDLKSSLATIINLLSFFRKTDSEKYPNLIKLCANIIVEKSLLIRLEEIIDDKGRIKDNASPELHRIRQELFKSQREIDKKIGQTLIKAKKAGWTDKDV
jgi:DNA mismatch repair protein MutS2